MFSLIVGICHNVIAANLSDVRASFADYLSQEKIRNRKNNGILGVLHDHNICSNQSVIHIRRSIQLEGGKLFFNSFMAEKKEMKTGELLEIVSNTSYKVKYNIAKMSGTCIRCKKSVKIFRDRSSRLEYSISALCQTCQDEIFIES